MAEILPIRAWRYNAQIGQEIEHYISPLFDVVSSRQREKLYANSLNSIHLSVPKGEFPSQEAKKTLQKWKEDHVLVQDKLPAIYVYFQYFSLPGSSKEYIRKGFIANIRLHNWEEKVILRHENTIPNAVNDRKEIVESTQLNVSPTHGLYTDADYTVEQYLDEAIRNPIYETEDYQGVREVLAQIQDAKVIQEFVQLLSDKQVILADGHHRMEGSIAYMNQMKEQNKEHTGKEGYNFHMMYFTNTESDDLRILPTHRLVHGLENFSEEALLEKLQEDFYIKPVENVGDIHEIILGKKWAFGLIFEDSAFKIRLKEDKLSELKWNFPDEVKELDLTVLHYFVIEKALGIAGKTQRSMENVLFERNFTECVARVMKGQANFALVTKDIPIETVKKVCYSGYTMPQKSTYFYPKAICGYLFSSIADDEFDSPVDLGF